MMMMMIVLMMMMMMGMVEEVRKVGMVVVHLSSRIHTRHLVKAHKTSYDDVDDDDDVDEGTDDED